VFSPLVADDDDELRVHCRYFFFLSIPTEDNKEAPICRHLLMLCSSIPKNDDELALVVVVFCFYAPRKDDDEYWFIVIFLFCSCT